MDRKRGKKKRVRPGFDCMRCECDITQQLPSRKILTQLSLYRSTYLCGSYKVQRDAHSDECIIDVFMHIVELFHSRFHQNDTWCIIMTETVTVSNVIAIAALVSEIWLAKEITRTHTRAHTHTHTHTHTHGLGYLL